MGEKLVVDGSEAPRRYAFDARKDLKKLGGGNNIFSSVAEFENNRAHEIRIWDPEAINPYVVEQAVKQAVNPEDGKLTPDAERILAEYAPNYLKAANQLFELGLRKGN